jgi:ATP-dependent Lon protease
MPPEHPTTDVPSELPVLPLREFVVFPYMVLPLFLFREESIAAVEDALAGDRLILLAAQRDPEVDDPGPEDLHRVGTVAMVMRILRLPDGRVKALVQGLSKAQIQAFVESDAACWARVRPLPEPLEQDFTVETEALMRAVRVRVEELLPFKNLPPEVLTITANVDDPGRLADLVASNLRLRLADAQAILETLDPMDRLARVDELLRRELEVTTMQAELQSQVKDEMSRGQREVFLREQLRAIQAELGEGDARGDEVLEYQTKLEEAGLPPEAFEEAMRQLRRLERMHPDGPEAQVVRTYLDWMGELPWAAMSPDQLDLGLAREILDTDHAHLHKIKDRILEFLGVRKLRQDSRGPILCFVGPPGVGKTSLGRSIARSMGREFVRVSLGGVRDEAEVRGHRRTYVGALPGRIVQGIKQAGTRNPVFMLDEIDKLGADYRGDPSSALLEVLDPEQNAHFSDHYLNVPFDLSSAFFIATANLLDPIPRPLRDRMEIVRLSGYTPEEKTEIARAYLIPRQTEEAGLPGDRIHWSDPAVERLVREYTAEAGVRNLERQVATVCRKVARRAAEGDESPVKLTRKNLAGFLGPAPYTPEATSEEGQIGVATGLAWTESGGDVLSIEAAMTRGKGIVLTGQLGEVMKESGHAALTWVRARAAELGIEEKVLADHEIHVHVPAGAIPKDGPSAGVTMATAIASLATSVAVRPDVAMTGELTLSGRVLPVGGVREKALAALRHGIRTVILPKKNLDDLEDVPREVKRKMTFVPVSHMSEVLAVALEGDVPRKRRRRTPSTPSVPAQAKTS